MEHTRQPAWVCYNCGLDYGHGPVNDYATWHPDKCGICGKYDSVTEPRDFGFIDLTKLSKLPI